MQPKKNILKVSELDFVSKMQSVKVFVLNSGITFKLQLPPYAMNKFCLFVLQGCKYVFHE